jgi:hypothetical protein
MTFDITKVCYKPSKELLGTKVYFHKNLNLLATVVTEENGVYTGIVDTIDERDTNMPFRVSGIWCSLIYPLEEPKEVSLPKYRPFIDMQEFISTYETRVSKNPNKNPPYTMPLIWVKHKYSETVELITTFCKDGVELGGCYMDWDIFFDAMVFLDNTPCGVEIKEEVV